jgi:ABC-type taurine transport system ATPase subunit
MGKPIPISTRKIIEALDVADADVVVDLDADEGRLTLCFDVSTTQGFSAVGNVRAVLDEATIREFARRYGVDEKAVRAFIEKVR